MPPRTLHPSVRSRPSGAGARAVTLASAVTLAHAAGFGLPTVPVGLYLERHGRLPSFFGLFDMYGGPWSATLPTEEFRGRLHAYLGVTALVAGSGWLLQRRSRLGGVLNLALLPVEAVFWTGFALPIPWLLGAARVVLVARGWRALEPRWSSPRPSALPTPGPARAGGLAQRRHGTRTRSRSRAAWTSAKTGRASRA